MSLGGAALALACLSARAPDPAGSPVVAPPSKERWRPTPTLLKGQWGCSPDPAAGFTICFYRPTGRRALADFFRSGLYEREFLMTQVHPRFCAWAQAEPVARAMMVERVKDAGSVGPVRFTARYDRLLGSTDTLRMAWMATARDLVWVELHDPGGIGPWEEAEFAALLSTVRSVDRPHDARRRARWLHAHPRRTGLPWANVPVCGIEREERLRLERELLARATLERPEDFEPWVYLGVDAERRGDPGPALAYFFDMIGHGTRDRAPLDRAALREADEFYAQALSRTPPAGSADPGGARDSIYPRDVPSLWAARGRALAKCGDLQAAAHRYATALTFEGAPSWGSLEAALWLAERAYAERDWPRARELYARAEQAWLAFYGDGYTLTGMGEPFYLRIAVRRKELGKRAD